MMRALLHVACVALAAAQAQTIVEIAVGNPQLSDLVLALQTGGLVETLSGPGPFTVFAPMNSGFAALGPNILDYVLNPDNKVALDNVLTYHVVAGTVYSSQLYNGENVTTLDNSLAVHVTVSSNQVFLNTNAQVIQADILASNGVIHLINNVLVPANFALPAKDIVQTAAGVASLSTLVTAVKAANLVATLSMPNGPYTVFAPTNAAFAKLPAAELQFLLAHPAELANVLLYHVLDHRVYADQIQNFEVAKTEQGQDVVFIADSGSILINGISTIIATNVGCTNGVVHLIDTVILPKNTSLAASTWSASNPDLPNIVQLAESVPSLSTLVTAVVAGGLVNTLSGAGPFTVFAPTNDAFNALPTGVLSYLLNNTKALDTVLTYHVVSGAVYSNQIQNNGQIPTFEGQNVTSTLTGGSVYINDAQVISANNQASNGVVHIIDGVLLPRGAPGITMSKRLRSRA
jgi:uncharacterized surface protein with fasciclin (FAS1) repeats